jgi:hypothetical protein
MTAQQPDVSALAAVAAYAPHLAQAFASLACDLALVLDRNAVITELALSAGSQLGPFTVGWIGRPLADVVTADTRRKIVNMLLDVAGPGLARRREVNLPSGQLADIPMAFTALRLGPDGPALVVGHDLRSVAQMQQRFMRVQQELERGYSLAMAAGSKPGAGTPVSPLAAGLPLPGSSSAPGGEGAELLNEASRAAFAAWLTAERLAAEGDTPSVLPAVTPTTKPSPRKPSRRRR